MKIPPKEVLIQYENNPNYEPQDAPVILYPNVPNIPDVINVPDEQFVNPVKTAPIAVQGASTNASPQVQTLSNIKEVLEYSGYSVTEMAPSVLLAIKFNVKNQNGLLINGATITVNGVSTAQSDANGSVFLPSVNQNDEIKITYTGYGDVIFKAAKAPQEITLTTTAAAIIPNPASVIPPKPVQTKKTNWFALLLLTGATVAVVKKMSKPKTAKVKI